MPDWRQELKDFIDAGERARTPDEEASELARFITEIAMPAFKDVAEELEQHGRKVTLRSATSSAAITVQNNGEEEIMYRIQGRRMPLGILPYAEVRVHERKGLRMVTLESAVRSGPPDYRLADVTKDEVIRNFLDYYTRRAARQ